MKRGKAKRDRKAQFYILAAVIIIAVFIGVAALANYARMKKGYTKIYDLGKELEIETGYVYDYGVYNGTDINALISNWSDVYYNYTKEQEIVEDWYFVYGNENELTEITFDVESLGEIGISGSGWTAGINITEGVKKTKKYAGGGGGSVQVTFEDKETSREFTYDFELEEGENFFFILRSGEYVAGVKEKEE